MSDDSAVQPRAFECDGEEWLVWLSGSGAYGTGSVGPGHLVAVHFARAAEPAVPVFEALLAGNRLAALFDDELRELFRCARRVVDAASLPETARPKARSRSLHDHGAPGARAQGYE